MTEQPTPPIDPRFDPAFQRGYADSPTHTADERWGLGAVARTWQAARTDARGADARAQDAGSPAVSAIPLAASTSAILPTQVANAAGGQGQSVATVISPASLADETPARTSRHNPFVYVLAALSILLFASGASIILRATQSQVTGVMSQEDMAIQQLAWSLAPPMLNGGVIGMIAVVFYLAFAWQRTELARAKSGRVTE